MARVYPMDTWVKHCGSALLMPSNRCRSSFSSSSHFGPGRSSRTWARATRRRSSGGSGGGSGGAHRDGDGATSVAPSARAGTARPGGGNRPRAHARPRARDSRGNPRGPARVPHAEQRQAGGRRSRGRPVGRRQRDELVDGCAPAVTELGEHLLVLFALVVVALVEYRRSEQVGPVLPRDRSRGEVVLINTIKGILDRVRPEFNPIAETLGPSFPSGHSGLAAASTRRPRWCSPRRRSPRTRALISGGAVASPSGWRAAASSSASTGSRTSSPASRSAGPGSASAPSRSAVASSALGAPVEQAAESRRSRGVEHARPGRRAAVRRRRAGSGSGRADAAVAARRPELHEPVRERLAPSSSSSCSDEMRLPVLVDQLDRVALDSSSGSSRCSDHSRSRVARARPGRG